MSEYFRKERLERDTKIILVQYILLVIVTLLLILFVANIGKGLREKAIEDCVKNSNTLEYCEWVSR